MDIFSGHILLNKYGERVDPEEALQNKIVGLYFSASWCSPCRDFTPILCDFYTELVEESEPPAQFEIVFISSDKSPEEMVDYMHDMQGDWLALPFHDPYKQFWPKLSTNQDIFKLRLVPLPLTYTGP
ncbi:nucleoredoxin like 2 L homeolog isoform X1 [Xenopus laevis]|uniref:Nucleoredoxin like 2 L homeolog isoform X1 n=1 Tax=Xenopus laevis TaxID=8355 RepID=A0A8J1M2J8_XENLA|nr:nucleoredoxin like 2 L homeolog isoform X1 [Xenopus laevis]